MAYCYDNLKLEKGMYHEAGRYLHSGAGEPGPLRSSTRGTALEGLDAFQRQLKRFDIKVKGAGSDVVEKFFRTADSAVLFPEYIARSVRQGMEEADLLPQHHRRGDTVRRHGLPLHHLRGREARRRSCAE